MDYSSFLRVDGGDGPGMVVEVVPEETRAGLQALKVAQAQAVGVGGFMSQTPEIHPIMDELLRKNSLSFFLARSHSGMLIRFKTRGYFWKLGS